MTMLIREMRLPMEYLCDILIRWIFANPLAENCSIVAHLDPARLHYLQVMLNPPQIPILSI